MHDPVSLRLQALIASLSEAVLVEDEHRLISLTNRAFCEMFGIPAAPEAMVGMDCSRAAEESKPRFRDPERFVARVQEVLAARETVIGDRLHMVDGRVLERDYVPVLQDGGSLGHLWKYRDVTIQVRAEERREQEKKFYQLVLDALPAQVAVLGRDGTYVYVSPGAIADEETRRWIVGRTDADYCARRGVDPGVARRRMTLLQEVVSTGRESHFQETLPVRGTNDVRHFLRFYTPVPGPDGATDLVLGYGLDITDRIRAEEQLREATRLAERSARAKESFLANMSHEIRTPLNAVIGTAHLLDSTPLDELQRQYVDAIRYSADMLLALINDILDLTKIGTGNIAFETVPFRLRELVNAVGDALRSTADGKGIALQIVLDEALPPVVVGDPTRLTQVLLNLAANAVKFTERGGVLLGARVAARDGDALRLEFRVTDTGIGIAEQHREAIFETFTQERSDTARRYGGTGLGLAIVRELVTRQGGEVSVESEVGVGSTFVAVLPARIGEMPSLAASGAAGEGVIDLSGLRVLLVEDNALNQFVATQVLTRAGAQIVVEGNGVLAVERLRADRAFDVILMDIQMPEMDGFEATRRIRDDLGIAGDEVPILALTASALVDQRSRAVSLGMDDFVMKPFSPDDLKRRIAGAVWRARHARQARAAATSTSADEAVNGEGADEVAGGAVDLAVLEAQTLGQPEFTIEMIDVYLAHLPAQWAAIRAAGAAMDRAALHAAAHKLKSACAVVGAGTLHLVLQSLEDAASSAPETRVAMLVQAAAPEVKRVSRALRHARVRYEGQLS